MDATVETFAHGVGNAVAKVGQDILDVSLKHLGHFDDWFELATGSPAVPAVEEIVGDTRLAIFPEPPELLLDGPGTGGL